jgi:RNA polymerase sigma factor (sigma-70 family)
MTSEAQALSANATFWEETYGRHFQKLCSRACKKLTRGRMAEAEDIVSETFMKIMLTKENANDISHPLQYLWTAIQRAWFSQQARREVANTEPLEDITMKTLEKQASVKLEPKVLEKLEREESLNELMYNFGPMSLKERTMVTMNLEGYSFGEIATALGEDLKTTRLRWRNLIARQRTRCWSNRAKSHQR